LQIQKSDVSNPIFKMDEAYKGLMEGLRAPPKLGTAKFDKYWDIQKATNNPVFRSNVMPADTTDIVDFGKRTSELIVEMKESHKVSRGIMQDIREWGLRAKIWSTNVNVLTAMVGQTTSAFKTLFNSAG
jgi:hypothetical protein